MRELQHPPDLLQAARQIHPADLRWGHIWAPAAIPPAVREVVRWPEKVSDFWRGVTEMGLGLLS